MTTLLTFGAVTLLSIAPNPIVAVIDLPAALTPEESATLPPEPVVPTTPLKPDAESGDESAWEAYREAQATHEAAVEQARAMAAARRDAERAARDGARARARVDRNAAALTASVEYALKHLGIFDVVTARTVRTAAGDAVARMHVCQEAQCLLEIATATEAAYLVTLRGEVGAPEIRVTLIEFLPREGLAPVPDATPEVDAIVLGVGSLPVGGSARDLIPRLFVRAMANELDRCYARAQTLAEGLSWPAAVDWLGRCLAIDSNHGPSLFLAGRAFFEQGDLRSAEKRLQQAILQEEEVGEASHLLGLIALRRSRESTAAAHFDAALSHGRDSFAARLLLGRLAINRDTEAAVAHLEMAIAMRPNHGEASYLLGLLLLLQGEKERARAHLEIAAAADYKAGDAHYELGTLASAAGEEAKAVSHYEAARERGRTSAEALLILGRHYVTSDPPRAVAAFVEARRKGARADDLDFLLGRAALAAGETATALSALARALAVEAYAAEAHLLLGQTYTELGNLPMAAAHYGPAIRMGRDSYAARVVLADAAVQRGEGKEAFEHFTAALAHRPGDGRAAYGAALVLLERKQTAEAVTYLERALSTGYRLAETRAHLGRAALQLDDRETCLAHFEAAAAAGSHEPDVYRFLAMARNRGGDIDGAVAMWGRVLEIIPGDAEASYRLGRLRIGQGRPEAARALLEHAAKARPYRGRAHRLLARLARERRDAAEALFHYEEAVKIVAADYELFANTGWAALEVGRDDLARHYLTRALAFRPGDGKLAFALGEIDWRGGRPLEARAFFEVALAAEHRRAETLYHLGEIAGALGDVETQRTRYQEAITAGADNAALYIGLAEILAEAGAVEEAVRYFAAGARAALRDANQQVAQQALTRGFTLAPDAVELMQIAEQLAAPQP